LPQSSRWRRKRQHKPGVSAYLFTPVHGLRSMLLGSTRKQAQRLKLYGSGVRRVIWKWCEKKKHTIQCAFVFLPLFLNGVCNSSMTSKQSYKHRSRYQPHLCPPPTVLLMLMIVQTHDLFFGKKNVSKLR